MENTRFTLTKEDMAKWSYNTALFFAPAGLLFLLAMQSGKSVNDALLILYTWGMNTAIDLIRKFIAQSPK